MGKRVILYLFLLFSLSLQAQTEEKVSLGNNSTEVDSTATAKPSAFKRAIKKFMNFSDFDTLYISPNRYNYALMVTHFSNFEYYSITSELPQPQKLSFSPNPHNKIGLYFGWRWIFLGWSVDVNDIFKKGTRKNRGTEFDLSLYSSKLGVDIFYRRTGNDYKIHKIRGFSDDIPSNYSEDFSGIKVDIKGLNLYYIFYQVAVSKNITAAARELYISQPAISKAISKLEQSLNLLENNFDVLKNNKAIIRNDAELKIRVEILKNRLVDLIENL